jgi:hypothetical protein
MSSIFPFSFLLHDCRLATPGDLDCPRSLVTGKWADKVPVIRLFGYSSPIEGSQGLARQCCVNVHGYMPKLFMDMIPGVSFDELADLIDMKISNGGACVYNITRLTRRVFYGYQDTDSEILSVELFRPIDVARVAELVTSGGIFISSPKVYEVHIPYLLQLLVEHGIQGVTPFGIDAREMRISQPKTTCMELEISVRVSGLLNFRKSDSQRNYPVPPPLSSGDSGDLLCEVLQALWEEEYNRTACGEKFPYKPEGIADGIDRPDCSEMSWIKSQKHRLAEWMECLKAQEIQSTENTQALAEAVFGGGFDMSIQLGMRTP